MRIAIAGATGLTGNLCLQQLLQHTAVSQVLVIGRRPSGISHTKLQEIILQDGQLPEPVQADAFICCLGTTIKKAGSQAAFKEVDLELPIRLATALFQQGCHTAAVVSAMGAAAGSSIFYNRTKGQMEEAFKLIGFKSLSILRPSIIEGNRPEKRFGETVGLAVMKFIQPLLVGSLKNYRAIKASDIATALVTTTLQAKAGTHIYLSEEIKVVRKNS